jgi:hypothetical protein
MNFEIVIVVVVEAAYLIQRSNVIVFIIFPIRETKKELSMFISKNSSYFSRLKFNQ